MIVISEFSMVSVNYDEVFFYQKNDRLMAVSKYDNNCIFCMTEPITHDEVDRILTDMAFKNHSNVVYKIRYSTKEDSEEKDMNLLKAADIVYGRN